MKTKKSPHMEKIIAKKAPIHCEKCPTPGGRRSKKAPHARKEKVAKRPPYDEKSPSSEKKRSIKPSP